MIPPSDMRRGRAAFVGCRDAVGENLREGAKKGVEHAKANDAAGAASSRLQRVDDSPFRGMYGNSPHITFAIGHRHTHSATHRQISHGVRGWKRAVYGRLHLL